MLFFTGTAGVQTGTNQGKEGESEELSHGQGTRAAADFTRTPSTNISPSHPFGLHRLTRLLGEDAPQRQQSLPMGEVRGERPSSGFPVQLLPMLAPCHEGIGKARHACHVQGQTGASVPFMYCMYVYGALYCTIPDGWPDEGPCPDGWTNETRVSLAGGFGFENNT